MNHILPFWDFIFYIAFTILGAYFGIIYFVYRINRDKVLRWRDEFFTRAINVWHSPDEEPTEGREIMVKYVWPGPVNYDVKKTPIDKDFLACVKKWAYIEDLEKLPGYKED